MAVIPPKGTSAYKAFQANASISHVSSGDGFSSSGGKIPSPKTGIDRLKSPRPSKVNDLIDKTKDALDDEPDPKPRPRPSVDSSGGSSHHTSAKKALKYYEAPLAEYYGFNKQTAYQEALANTSYRREMADMRKAGLNPSVIYGSHNTSGADSGILPREDSAGGYRGSGGAGGSGRRYRGGNSGKYVFSGGAYYGTMAVVGTVVAAATKNVGAGMAAAGLAGTAMKALNGFLKK